MPVVDTSITTVGYAPSLLRLQLLVTRPALTLTEVELVDDALHLRRIDARDGVPSEVRAVTPSPTDWAHLGGVLDGGDFWSWPRTWPPAEKMYCGEWKLGVAWNGRIWASTGPIGMPHEIDLLLDEVERLVGTRLTDRVRPRRTASHALPSPPPPPSDLHPAEGVVRPSSGRFTADSAPEPHAHESPRSTAMSA